MKNVRIFLAGLVLSVIALVPAAATADQDELEVTMKVLDSIADIDGEVTVMQGPEDDGTEGLDDQGGEHDGERVTDQSGESGEHTGDDALPEQEFVDAASEDDFTHDEDFESDEDEDHFEDESDFDESDDIDLDEPDDVPMDEEEPMHDEEKIDGTDDDAVFEDDLVSLVAGSDV